jgi:very-short-patch-repair endonuclease
MAEHLSKIQELFIEACGKAGIRFDTEEQVSRYRVDCIDKSRRLVVELDGHEYHKSKEDRTSDAKRDRQLHRDGYTVLRFTGSEVWSDTQLCVAEVQQTLALMEAQPVTAGAIYIDWLFVDRTSTKLLRHYQNEHPEKDFRLLTLSQLLDFLAGYLQLKGRYDVHLFGTASSFSTSIVDIDALKLRKSEEALFNVTEHQHEWLAIELIEHLHKQGTEYDRLIMVADDNAYPPLLDRGRRINVLIRRDSDSTSMASVRSDKWQDIDYIVGWAMGLATHEL